MSDSFTNSNGSQPNDAMLEKLADAIAAGFHSEDLEGSDVHEHFTEAEIQEFEAAAAAVACACATDDVETMPNDIRLRCSGAGRVVATDHGEAKKQGPHRNGATRNGTAEIKPGRSAGGPLKFTPPRAERESGSKSATLGWLAAAACLAISVAAWWPAGAEAPMTVEARMAALVDESPDLTRWDWAAWGGEAYAKVAGEVVWSEAAQEGYMVLEGMPTNDPSAVQYQLWVVESSRGTPLQVPPVDGGVFDVRADGRVIIPIRCTLPATDVVAFAITIEEPGGVVVSDQSRKTVIAAAPVKG